jgi:hypothetical protein
MNVVSFRLIRHSSLALIALWFAGSAFAAEPASSAPPLGLEIDGGNRREIVEGAQPATTQAADGETPQAIGFITTNDAFCYQPDSSRNECYINWRLHSVSAGSDNMRNLRILIGGRLVLHMSAFFQNSLSYQAAMVNPGGFKVVCGPPSGSDPLLGNSYSYQISAMDSNNLSANNYGTVFCPAFSP